MTKTKIDRGTYANAPSHRKYKPTSVLKIEEIAGGGTFYFDLEDDLVIKNPVFPTPERLEALFKNQGKRATREDYEKLKAEFSAFLDRKIKAL